MDVFKVLLPMFETLNQLGVKYCVLRNYGFLLERRQPRVFSERSIDLVVSRADFLILQTVMMQLKFQQRKPQFSLSHKAFFYIDGKESISFDVQVGGVHWNDMVYLDEKHILTSRVRKSFFYVPADEDAFVMLLTHSILGKRMFKKEYKEILTLLVLNVNAEYTYSHLKEIFNSPIAYWLIKRVHEQQYAKILQRKYFLIFYFIVKSSSHIFTFGSLFLRWLRWKKIFQLYPLISIIGPDGAGKTTAVHFLSNHLQKNNRKVTIVYTGRGRSHLLPLSWIGRFYKRKEKRRDGQKEARGQEKRTVSYFRKGLYTVFAPVYAFDLLLRYLFYILPSRLSRRIVITDRYCSDIFLMDHVPLLLKIFLVSMFPRPTLTFYLYNTSEELHQRREEESAEELTRQMYLFCQLTPLLGAIEIKTDSQENTENLIAERVMAYLYKEWF